MNFRSILSTGFASLSLMACAAQVSDQTPDESVAGAVETVVNADSIARIHGSESFMLDMTSPDAHYVLETNRGGIDTTRISVLLPDGLEKPLTDAFPLPGELAAGSWMLQAPREPSAQGIGMSEQALWNNGAGENYMCMPGFGCVGSGDADCGSLRESCDGTYGERRTPTSTTCYCK